ncbi:uncharacterized protein DS421_5g162180 [Arachis hypogaea]|nr:uncharacterized protein DS421_5g162180 [Arachis hypogaea]
MSEPKKVIVRELGFGGLMHIPPMNMPHKLLKELANSFKLDKNTLETSYGSFKVKPKTIGAALSINASGDPFPNKVSYKNLSEENKLIFRRFQGNTLKKLTDKMMSIGVENEQDRLMFKRMKSSIFRWCSCCQDKKGEEKPGLPWVSNWNREQLIVRIRVEIDGHMGIVKMAKTKKKLKEMKEKEKKEEKKETKMESRQRKQILEDSSSESKSESTDETEIGTETIEGFLRQHQQGMPKVSLATETDPLFQGQTEQSSVNKPLDSITSEPQQVDESTPIRPPAPSKIYPVPESTAAALLMMAPTASYIPKELLLPSFSLRLADSNQEET